MMRRRYIMPHIVLTEEQARVLADASGPVEVRDAEGRTLACFTPLTAEEMEVIARLQKRPRSTERGVPSAEVQAHLRKLEEIDQREGLDAARAKDLLRRMRAGEAV
jgi:hypothetical protein